MAKAGKKKKTKAKSKFVLRQFVWKWLKRLVLFLVLLLIAPYLLIFIYKIDGVKPVSTLMLSETLTGRSYERTWIDLDEIAPVVIQSVMMSEDGQFCAHSGVDWDAINIVIEEALEGEASRGASTIAMQTSKNLFLTQTRSVIRKGLEIPLALTSDYVWGKERMMELYLNIAQWGHGVYGIEAAAQTYFGRSASKLTRKQAALLAVTLPNPILRNPAKPSNGLQRLANKVEKRARQSGAYIKCIYP
ncbi:MAG: monofunctional biosynthetic peptidoglycan transglycosylase [Rhizobiaceae bacterium]|nr:monofunctional biosynthetic peptidoglycan transglycosylase [Rhizobiaceae bacterium]